MGVSETLNVDGLFRWTLIKSRAGEVLADEPLDERAREFSIHPFNLGFRPICGALNRSSARKKVAKSRETICRVLPRLGVACADHAGTGAAEKEEDRTEDKQFNPTFSFTRSHRARRASFLRLRGDEERASLRNGRATRGKKMINARLAKNWPRCLRDFVQPD